MSRKWERMVERNKKAANKIRTKQGKSRISETGSETMQAFKGRAWILPLFLIVFSLFFGVAYGAVYNHDTSYWFTVCSYAGLGLLIFWLRRPTLRIGKASISSRRFSGDKVVNADGIAEITLLPGYVVIQLKEKKARWVFTRITHLFKMDEMVPAVEEFARKNGVLLKDERKK